MKSSLSRSLRTVYSREPTATFIFFMALADVALGGLSEQWTLFSLGLLMIAMAGLIRWFRQRKTRKSFIYSSPRRYLNPSNHDLIPLPPLKRKRYYQK